MAVSLVLVRRDKSQVEVPVRHASEIIGRHTDCKIRIPDASVSRQHCELSIKEGKVVLRDLGSSNGTYVNRRRISQTELAPGDLLAIGKFVFVVRVDGRPATIDAGEALEDGAVALGAEGAGAGSRAGGAPEAYQPKGLLDHDEDEDDLLGRNRPGAQGVTPATPAAPAQPAPRAAPQPASKPAPKSPAKNDKDGSSEFDFDFLDEDESKMPKL